MVGRKNWWLKDREFIDPWQAEFWAAAQNGQCREGAKRETLPHSPVHVRGKIYGLAGDRRGHGRSGRRQELARRAAGLVAVLLSSLAAAVGIDPLGLAPPPLFDLPTPPRHRRRGRPRKYGPNRIHLARRAAHPGGWQNVECVVCGKAVTKTPKTFVATYRPADGPI